MSLRSGFRVVMSVTISARKRCSVRFCLPLLIGGLVSRSRCLCLYVYSGVQRMSCCNFLRCVAGFSRRSIIDLPLQCSLMCISSCVPYVSGFSGLSVIDLPLQFSLMCISSCVPYVAVFSGLSVIDCPFSVL